MKRIRIFISSPGDVHEERERARGVVHQLRRRYANRFDLQAVLWEELPLQADMSFQQGVDVVLSEKGVDIAVFILWSRLGSPLGPLVAREDGEPYRSGTEREWDLMLRARQRCQNEGSTPRPAIIVYTRNDDVSFEERLRGKSDDEKARDINQKLLVRQFIEEEFRDAETGTNIRAYHRFDQPTVFAKRLREHLTGLLDSIAGEGSSDPVWSIAEQGPPFRGLDVFEFEHGPIFFGREDEIVTIRARLRDQARQGLGFMLICGPSGSGKSSLARAGVMPDICSFEVDESVHGWRRLAIKPASLGGNLLQGLVDSLIASDALPELGQWKLDVAVPADDEQFSSWLVRFQIRVMDALKSSRNATSSRNSSPLQTTPNKGQASTRLVLLIDQLEELFSNSSIQDKAHERFFEALESLARCGQVWILATVRSDFYQHCQSIPALVRMKEGGGQFDLLPLTPDGLARVITGPATLAGLTFERDGERVLSDAILTEAAEHKELLPLVEHLLLELCDHRTDDGMLTFDEFCRVGGVKGALRQRCEETFDRLSVGAQTSFDDVLSELVTLSDGQENGVRRTVPQEQIATTADRRELIDAMVSARLFTATGLDGNSVVSVTHEALLRVWPRITEWIHRNREFLRLRANVEQSCGRWLSNGCDPSLLLPEGLPLEEGRRLKELGQTRSDGQPCADGQTRVDKKTTEYIEHSETAAELQRRKATRRRRAVLATLSAATVVLALLGIYAWNQFNAAKTALATVERQKKDVDDALIEAANAAKEASEINQERFNQILATSNHMARRAADRGEYDIAAATLLESRIEIALDELSEARTNSLAKQVALVGRDLFAVDGIHKLPGNPIYVGPSKKGNRTILCTTIENKIVSVAYNSEKNHFDEAREVLDLGTLSIYRTFPSGDQSCITMLAIDQSNFANPKQAIVVSQLDSKPAVTSKLELLGTPLNVSSFDGESTFGIACSLPQNQMKGVCWDEKGKKIVESEFVEFIPVYCLPLDRKTIFAVGHSETNSSNEARLIRLDGDEPVVSQVVKFPGSIDPRPILKSYKRDTELFIAVCLDQAVQNLKVVADEGVFRLELASHIPITGDVLTLEFLNNGTTLGVQHASPLANTTIVSFFGFEHGLSVASSNVASGAVGFSADSQLTAIVGAGGMLEVWNGNRQLGMASMPTDACEFLAFNEDRRTILAVFLTGYVCSWHLDRNIFDVELDRRIAFDSKLATAGAFLSKSRDKPLPSDALDISPLGVLFKRRDSQVDAEESGNSRNDSWAIEYWGTEPELIVRCEIVSEPLAAAIIWGEDSNLYFGVVSAPPGDTREFVVFNAAGENTTRLPLPSWVSTASITVASDSRRLLISIRGSGNAEVRSYAIADGGKAKLESNVQGPISKLQYYRLLSNRGYFAVLHADGWSLYSAKNNKIVGKIPFIPISMDDSKSTILGIFSFEGKGIVVQVPFSDSAVEFQEFINLQSIPDLREDSHFILTRDYGGALLLVRSDGKVWFGDSWSSLNVSLQCASVDECGILTAVGEDGIVYHASLYALSVPFLAEKTIDLEPAGYVNDLAVSSSLGQLRFYDSNSGKSVLAYYKFFSDSEKTLRAARQNIFTETSLAGTMVKRYSLKEHSERRRDELLNVLDEMFNSLDQRQEAQKAE